MTPPLWQKVKNYRANRNSSGQKGMAGHTSSDERKQPTAQITVPSTDLIQI